MKKYLLVVLTTIFLIFSFHARADKLTELERLNNTYTDDRYYNEVCWLTSHNSYAYHDPSFDYCNYIGTNQNLNINGQLMFGVRSFMLDLYHENNDPNKHIILAHGLKEKGFIHFRFYKQKFSSPFLDTIKKWFNDPKNSNDIITIHLESYIRNYDKIIEEFKNAGLYDKLFDLCEYNGGAVKKGDPNCTKIGWLGAYILEPSQLKWPTLGEMRKNNKRLVVFSDKIEDMGYGIMSTLSTIETQYDTSSFPLCEMRVDYRAVKAPIFIMNHFSKYEPIPIINWLINYASLNNFSEIAKRSEICALQENKWPNFIAVDNVGSVLGNERQVVLDINIHDIICKNSKGNCCSFAAPFITGVATTSLIFVAGTLLYKYYPRNHPHQD